MGNNSEDGRAVSPGMQVGATSGSTGLTASGIDHEGGRAGLAEGLDMMNAASGHGRRNPDQHRHDEEKRQRRPSETLLVAEDDEIVKNFMERMLVRAGYRVIVASDGEEAVARFREHHDISLVLSDIVMPKKNGKEILEEMRRVRPGIRVLFISGHTPDVMDEQGIVGEGIDFISKPFTREELMRKIRKMLDKAEAVRDQNAVQA